MRASRDVVLALCLIAACLAAGCRSVRVVYRDPGFGAAGIASARLAMGGVAPTEAARGYLEQDRLAEMVCRQLQSRWPSGRILTPDDVVQVLGTNACQHVLESFFAASALSPESLERLRPLAGQARYLLLVNVRRNDVDQNYFKGGSQDYDASTGEYYGSFYYYARSRATRHVEADFFIFDLSSGKPVWIATGKDRGSAHNSARSSLHPVSVSAMGPPPASDLLDKVIRRAIRRLPGS